MKKILIVDDQPDIGRLVQIVLAAKGRTFIVARNGAEGVSLAESERPDLILMDLMMPGALDGFQAIRAIRQSPRAHDCPVIAMTARLMEESDREQTRRCGAQAYVRKPFDIRDLQRLVGRFLDDEASQNSQGGENQTRH